MIACYFDFEYYPKFHFSQYWTVPLTRARTRKQAVINNAAHWRSADDGSPEFTWGPDPRPSAKPGFYLPGDITVSDEITYGNVPGDITFEDGASMLCAEHGEMTEQALGGVDMLVCLPCMGRWIRTGSARSEESK